MYGNNYGLNICLDILINKIFFYRRIVLIDRIS